MAGPAHKRTPPLDACLRRLGLLAAAICLSMGWSAEATAAGFEVGENTTLSLARGGTGVATKSDPSALYFNPALLPRAEGVQVMTSVNVIDLNLQFQRDDLVYRKNRREQRKDFGMIENQSGPFPIPALAVSWDFGLENFAAGIGAFAPHAYGRRCFGDQVDGECEPVRDGPGRYLLIESNLIEFYLTGGAGYQFDLGNGTLSAGASVAYAYQENDFALAINAELPPKSPWEEDPADDAIFRAEDLTGHNFFGILGLTYQEGGMRIAASYRPPMRWESEGTAQVEFPDKLSDLGPGLTDDGVIFRGAQAGSLRIGWSWETGTHPGFDHRPRWGFEVNGVWENWSAVENFEMEPQGKLKASELPDSAQDSLPELQTIVQRKNWQDTFSLRLGGSWGPKSWLTLHGGGMLETAAQPTTSTHLAFVSWQRYAGSLGASFHPWPWMDIDLAFMHVASPDRDVDRGEVHQAVPLSKCQGPDYDHSSCEQPGQPPGSPQNEGQWSANANIGSLGVRLHF